MKQSPVRRSPLACSLLFCAFFISLGALGAVLSCPDAVVATVVRHSANGPEAPGSEIRSGFVLCKWAHMSLPGYVAHDRPEFLEKLGWRWTREGALRELEARFHHRDLKVRLTLLRASRRDPHAILFGAVSLGDRVVGSAYATYFLDGTGAPIMELSGVSFEALGPEYAGVSGAILDLFQRDVGGALGVRKLTAIGDYLGRYVWAKFDRFSLANEDPDKTPWRFTDINGETNDTWAQTLKNLARFLERNRLSVSDLRFTRKGQTAALGSPGDLKTLQELASLRHKDGKKIEVRPMLGVDAADRGFFGPKKAFGVGGAFMAADYTDFEGPAVLTHWGARVSPYAMPPYRFESRSSGTD